MRPHRGFFYRVGNIRTLVASLALILISIPLWLMVAVLCRLLCADMVQRRTVVPILPALFKVAPSRVRTKTSKLSVSDLPACRGRDFGKTNRGASELVVTAVQNPTLFRRAQFEHGTRWLQYLNKVFQRVAMDSFILLTLPVALHLESATFWGQGGSLVSQLP
jgi:hypothetical protein